MIFYLKLNFFWIFIQKFFLFLLLSKNFHSISSSKFSTNFLLFSSDTQTTNALNHAWNEKKQAKWQFVENFYCQFLSFPQNFMLLLLPRERKANRMRGGLWLLENLFPLHWKRFLLYFRRIFMDVGCWIYGPRNSRKFFDQRAGKTIEKNFMGFR